MIIDSSALIAIIANESEALTFIDAIIDGAPCRMSAANFLETAIVIDGKGDATASRQLDALIRRAEIKIEPVTYEQAQIARQAYQDFGRGRHPAALNFGDCFAYALSKEMGEPLLFKGNDFNKTDVAMSDTVTSLSNAV